jgi:hypothetical protein
MMRIRADIRFHNTLKMPRVSYSCEPQSIIQNSLFIYGTVLIVTSCVVNRYFVMPIRILFSIWMPTGYPDTDPDPYLNLSSSLFTAVPVYIVLSLLSVVGVKKYCN